MFNKQLWIIIGHHVSVSAFSSPFWLLLPQLVCLSIYTLLVIRKPPTQSPVAMGLGWSPPSQEVEGWEEGSQNK